MAGDRPAVGGADLALRPDARSCGGLLLRRRAGHRHAVGLEAPVLERVVLRRSAGLIRPGEEPVQLRLLHSREQHPPESGADRHGDGFGRAA